jgi:hypothetical protein
MHPIIYITAFRRGLLIHIRIGVTKKEIANQTRQTNRHAPINRRTNNQARSRVPDSSLESPVSKGLRIVDSHGWPKRWRYSVETRNAFTISA